MWTITYRTFYIHGYCDKDEVSVDFKGGIILKYKSLLAAKRAITAALRKAYGYSTMSAQNKRIYGFKK